MTTFENFGLVGSNLEEMEAFHEAKKEEAVKYFTSTSSTDGEFDEVELPGEICPDDYEFTMRQMAEMDNADNVSSQSEFSNAFWPEMSFA